jgi:hypothetical protein
MNRGRGVVVVSRPVLRAVLHVLVSASMIASPAEAPVDVEPDAGDIAVPEPPADAPASESPTGAPPQPELRESEPPATTEATPPTPAAAEPAEPVEPEGPADEDDDDDVPYDPLIDSPEAQRARSWVRSGAVFMGIGGVLTIGAIAMSQAKVNTLEDQNACDPRRDFAGNGCLEEARNRAAVAMAVPGALLLAGGIAMLAVGKVQQKRLRASLRASRRELMLGVQLAF